MVYQAGSLSTALLFLVGPSRASLEVPYVDTPSAKILNFGHTSLELATSRELTTNLVHTVTFTLGIWDRMTINRRK